MPSKRRSRKSSRKGSRKGSRKSSRTSKKGSRKLRLVSLGRSPNKDKKYRAKFSDGTHTDFGATGYSDFTKHKDVERKKRYIQRHSRNENWRNMKSPGALSRYVLWNKPSLRASVADYKSRLSRR